MKDKYYNNDLNKFLSDNLDAKRTIMDIDGVHCKYGYNTVIMYDYKSLNDRTTNNTLITMSMFSNVKLNDNRSVKTFIVKENKTSFTIHELQYSVEHRNRDSFIKESFEIDEQDGHLIIEFLSPETHEKTKQLIREKRNELQKLFAETE
jgi:hypothetical protein